MRNGNTQKSMQAKKTFVGNKAPKASSMETSRRSKDSKVTVRWDNKEALSSVASSATATANRKTKRTTTNVVEMKGAALVKRDAKTGRFVEIKKIDPVVVNTGKMTLKINRK